MGVAATILGQSEIPNRSTGSSNYIQTSKLVGRKVKSSDGKEIGVLKDVVIDRSNGCMAYTVVSTGGAGTGVVSGDGKIVAVPWAVYSPTSDLSVLTVSVNREKIYNAPAFEYTRIDEYARPDYVNNVYAYYDVRPGPRSVAAGTDVTGTAGETASPGEVASSPAATGSLNRKPLSNKHASSTAGSYEATSANPLPKTIRDGRAAGARSTIDRDETASSTTAEEFSSRSTTGPNENRKSPRKAIEDTPTRRPSATPQSAEEQE